MQLIQRTKRYCHYQRSEERNTPLPSQTIDGPIEQNAFHKEDDHVGRCPQRVMQAIDVNLNSNGLQGLMDHTHNAKAQIRSLFPVLRRQEENHPKPGGGNQEWN